MEYTIWIEHTAVPVTEAVYRAYWQGRRKEKYFAEGDIHNKTFSYDALDTEEMNGCDIFYDTKAAPVEQQVISRIERTCLHKALDRLDADERSLVCRLYYYGESLRRISRIQRVPLSTLQYRHQKILRKLKRLVAEEMEGAL